MRFSIILFLTFLQFTSLNASGPPIKNGKFTVPFVKINLSKKQVQQAIATHHIELTKLQLNYLKKAATNLKLPKVLKLITLPYMDCACFLEFYGLWIKRNEVAISINQIYIPQHPCHTIRTIKDRLSNKHFFIGFNGDIYTKGKQISFNDFKKTVRWVDLKGKVRLVSVGTPPLINKKVMAAVLRIQKK